MSDIKELRNFEDILKQLPKEDYEKVNNILYGKETQ